MTSLEKVLDLAKKLKALADRGVGGEKVNARSLLEKLLKKHGLKIEDLELEAESYHDFKFKHHQKVFFEQVASTVVGSKYAIYKYEKKKDTYTIRCTHIQAIELQAKFDFYWAVYNKECEKIRTGYVEVVKRLRTNYKKDLEIYYKAFVIKQGLFPANPTPSDVNEMTPEEINDFMKIYSVAGTIAKEEWTGQTLKKSLE